LNKDVENNLDAFKKVENLVSHKNFDMFMNWLNKTDVSHFKPEPRDEQYANLVDKVNYLESYVSKLESNINQLQFSHANPLQSARSEAESERKDSDYFSNTEYLKNMNKYNKDVEDKLANKEVITNLE